MRFGFSVTPGNPIGVGEEMRRAEGLGYDRFGVWDSPALFRETWTTLAAVARDTERIRLGTWVTNPLSRHPLVTAAAAATVDDLAPGRVYIGIGAGGTGVWHLGMETAKLAELEAYILAVRGLLETGSATWNGHAADAAVGRPAPHPDHHGRPRLALASARREDRRRRRDRPRHQPRRRSARRSSCSTRARARAAGPPTTSTSGSRRSGGPTRSRARRRRTAPGRQRRSRSTSPTRGSSTSSSRRSSRHRCSRSAKRTT